MLVFTHIPRTGGTSLRQYIAQRVSSHRFMDALSDFAFATDAELRGVEFVATHCGHGVLKRLPEARRLVILRDPVERVISHYHYLREQDANVSYASHYAKTMTLADFVAQTNPAVSTGVENAQVWHLVEDKGLPFRQRYAGLTEEARLSLALENLATYDFIGFYDQLEKTFSQLAEVLGWIDGERPRLAASRRPPVSAIDAETLGLIRERVGLDERLYRNAGDLFRASGHSG